MKTLYNECIQCKERWQVIGSKSPLDWGDIYLDDIDYQNMDKFGQLFSICEDCNGGECESVFGFLPKITRKKVEY